MMEIHQNCIWNDLKSLINEVNEKKVNINERDRVGDTGLHLACREGNVQIIEWLISNGADVNARNSYAVTPYHVACWSGEIDVIKLMIKGECILDDKDLDGKTGLDILETYHPNKVAIIKEFISLSIKPQAKIIRGSTLTPSSSISAISSSTTVPLKCFLSHDWGLKPDETNHKNVKRISEALNTRNVSTWLDENMMSGDMVQKITDGINNCGIVVVFITDNYRNKVNQPDTRDYCKYEFRYAISQKGPHLMIPVVMEASMRSTRDWQGELVTHMGGRKYIDFSDVFNGDNAIFEQKIQELIDEIEKA